MRVLLSGVGSAGDVLPFIGLGRELARRGHEPILLAAEPFETAAEAAGVGFVSCWPAADYDAATHDPDLWHPRRGLRLTLGRAAEGARLNHAALARLHLPGRTLAVGSTLAFGARIFRETHGVPLATVHLASSIFRSDHQQPVLAPGHDFTRAPRWAKRLLWWIIDRVFSDPIFVPRLNAFRAEMGLAPISRAFHRWMHSPDLILGMFPGWFAPPQPDWPGQLRLTGFPLYDTPGGEELPEELETFLAAGDPPVVLTPGSANRQAAEFMAAGAAACSRLGRRTLLLTPYAEQLPPRPEPAQLHVPHAPFSALLPRCAALVHHGGIGTCAQGLAAGIPQLVMPLAFDQHDNAARLERLGVGRWIPPRRFTAGRAAAALGDLLEQAATAAACRQALRLVAGDPGILRACDLLERLHQAPAA